MSLIYSRPRIKIPKFFIINNKRNSKNKYIKKVLLIFIILVIVFITSVRAVTPLFNRLCSDRAKSTATLITNEETTNAIKDYKYSDFIIIHKDEDGNVLMLESNMKNINNVTSDVAYRIQTKINNSGDDDVTISLGSFTGINLLSGRGVKVPFRISTIGNVETNIKSEFVTQGINQTIHRLYLDIECSISILTPFNTIDETITSKLILAENVIVGEIPEAYYNISGVSESDAMNLMG